jgi:hypothetical protein
MFQRELLQNENHKMFNFFSYIVDIFMKAMMWALTFPTYVRNSSPKMEFLFFESEIWYVDWGGIKK